MWVRYIWNMGRKNTKAPHIVHLRIVQLPGNKFAEGEPPKQYRLCYADPNEVPRVWHHISDEASYSGAQKKADEFVGHSISSAQWETTAKEYRAVVKSPPGGSGPGLAEKYGIYVSPSEFPENMIFTVFQASEIKDTFLRADGLDETQEITGYLQGLHPGSNVSVTPY